MMTRVVLGGAMGRIWGKEQRFDVCTPRDALNMVNANKPGFVNQIRRNSEIFAQYRVTLEYSDGSIEHLSNDTYFMEKNKTIKCMRFMPLFRGTGKWFGAIVGVVLIVVGCIMYAYGGQALVMAGSKLTWASLGTSLIIAGATMTVSTLISAMIKPSSSKVDDSEDNYFFNGPVNTTEQAVPIPLVFGRCKVGSRVISSSISIKDR